MGWSWNVRVALHSSELYALDFRYAKSDELESMDAWCGCCV